MSMRKSLAALAQKIEDVLSFDLAWTMRQRSERTIPDGMRELDEAYQRRLEEAGEYLLSFAPEPDSELGFANLPEFVVVGKKKTTNRKNTRNIRAADEEAARKYAIDVEGLMEPLEVSRAPFEPALDLYSEDIGVMLPQGCSRWDAWMFELSVSAGDCEPITPGFMAYLTSWGIPMSWLAGRNHAADALFDRCGIEEKATMYAYGVYCDLHSRDPGDIRSEALGKVFEGFFDEVVKNPDAYNSLSKRPGSDFWNPSKKTKAYPAALSYLEKMGIE